MKNSEIGTVDLSFFKFKQSYQSSYSKQVSFSCKSYGKTLENQHKTRNDYRIFVNRQRTAFKNSLIYD